MNKMELLMLMVKRAKEFRADADWFERNIHMHAHRNFPPEDSVVDATLVGFINHFAAGQGIDLALYASDLNKP